MTSDWLENACSKGAGTNKEIISLFFVLCSALLFFSSYGNSYLTIY